MKKLLYFIFIIATFSSCFNNTKTSTQNLPDETVIKQNEQHFTKTLEKHLNALSNKDLGTLKSTLSPKGNMQLILTGTEIINSVDGFMKFHEEWFKDTTWTLESKILNTEVDDNLGLGIVETIYSEPERNGVPYFNRMTVSYVLKKVNGEWYVIKDHATSTEKSTDD